MQLSERLHCTATLLLTYAQLRNHFTITLDVMPSQVIEQSATLTDDFQQPTTGCVILGVRLEMFGEVSDSLAQQCDLDFRGPCIGCMDSIRANDCVFIFLGETHRSLSTLSL